MSQALYDLPEGWEWVSFESLMYVKGGKRLPKDTGFQEEKTMFPYIRVSDFNDKGGINLSDLKYISEDVHNLIKNYTISSSDLYISIAGTIGKTGIVPESLNGANLTENAAKLVIKDTSLLALRYLYLFTLTNIFSEQAGLATKQVAQPKLALSRLSAINIPFPPLAEQTRIVEKLDAVLSRIDTAIDELQQSLALVDAMFKSGLDGVFEDVYAHSAIKKLSELTTKIGSGATPKGGGSAYKESGISLIRSLNVHDLNFKYDGLAFIDDEQAKALSNVEVSSGDVLLNITGASIARCCIVPDGILPARVNQHVCILRPNHLLNSEFLNYLIVSPKFKSALLFQGAGGATRQALTKAMIENFDIPLPTLDRQEEVIETIKQLNDKTTQLKTELTAKIDLFNQLKASILDGAFRGEL